MKTVKNSMISILTGLLVGIITLFGQKYLPINLNFLANSGAVWLIPAFLLSYFFRADWKHSIMTCTLCLISCVFGYYIFEALYNHHNFIFGGYIIIWLACAIIGGIIFGLGAGFANQKNGWLKFFGQNLLPAVFLSEGINKVIHIEEYRHMIPAVILVTLIGIVLYGVINQKTAWKKKNLISLLLLTALGLAGYEVIYQITY